MSLTKFSQHLNKRRVETIASSWSEKNSRCKEAGKDPNTYVMDNEASKYLKDALREADI